MRRRRGVVPPGAVYVARRMARLGLAGSKWGNPFKIGLDGTRGDRQIPRLVPSAARDGRTPLASAVATPSCPSLESPRPRRAGRGLEIRRFTKCASCARARSARTFPSMCGPCGECAPLCNARAGEIMGEDDTGRSLTYREPGAALGVQPTAARMHAHRRGWPKRASNKVGEPTHVLVPESPRCKCHR